MEQHPEAQKGKPDSGHARRPGGISRPAWHFIVDLGLLAAVLVLAWISAMLQFVFPPATAADGWSLWGRSYDGWSRVRFGSLCAFLGIALLHVMLQWDWDCNFVASRLSRIRGEKIAVPKAVRTLYGVGMLIALLTTFLILLAIAQFMAQPGQ